MLGVEDGFPAGYDQSGKSLYYDKGLIYKPLWRIPWICRSKELRFGQASNLKLDNEARDLSGFNNRRGETLKEYIRTSLGEKQTPIYIFDDHNHALFAWYEALIEGKIEKGANLVTFDDHPDKEKADFNFTGEWTSLRDIANYTRSIFCNMFIQPALSSGLVRSVYWVNFWKENEINMHTVSCAFAENSNKYMNYTTLSDSYDLSLSSEVNFVPKRTIVDIDIDYFESITDADKERIEIEKLREAMSHADIITIATSPGFISGDRAIRLANELLRS